jgi:hypothetical protein
MKRLSSLSLASFASLCAFVPVAQAYEWDSQTVGYTDYGSAGYYRDYCHNNQGGAAKVYGYAARLVSNTVLATAAVCQNGPDTPRRGSMAGSGGTQWIYCPSTNYAVDGLRGYSDQGGLTSIDISCNNGSDSSYSPWTSVGRTGPYYNAVRCPSGTVAWGFWGSVGSTRLGRLGMICNDWWP